MAHEETQGVKGNNNAYALFNAAVRKQLQGAIGTGPAAHSLSIGRDRYSQRRKSHARISRQESERAGSAAGSGARPLPCGIECHSVAPRQQDAAAAGESL